MNHRFVVSPKLDPATVGISFVDILFALAVGQVLDPLKNWGEDPHAYPISLPTVLQLGVVLVLTLTSWVGYHGSANRPRFRLAFFNLELFKFCLDIAMVVVYFIAAAFAARGIPSLRIEALLLMVSFGLYSLWDLAGAVQKRGPDNEYKKTWEEARKNPERLDVFEEWSPTNRKRIMITFIGLAATMIGWFLTLQISALHRPTRLEVTVFDIIAIVVLVCYRVGKDHVNPKNVNPGLGA